MIKPDHKTNYTISQINNDDFHEKFTFDADTIDYNNQTQEFEGGIFDKYNTINPSQIGLKARFSLANNKSVQNLKIAKKKSSSKTKGKFRKIENSLYENDKNKSSISKFIKMIPSQKKFKKSTYHDLSCNQISLSSTFDNGNSTLREVITKRQFEPKTTKSKKLLKSTSVMKFEKQKTNSLSQRKSSCAPISTSKLFHLPKDFCDPRTIKNSDKAENISSKLNKSIFSQKCFNIKTGSMTTKSKNKSSFTKNPQVKVCKKLSQNKSCISINQCTNNLIAKIKSTHQPSKPADERNEAFPEYEGSSFKTSKMSVIKNTPQETKQRKSPLSFIERRNLSFHQNLKLKSDEKKSVNLELEEDKFYCATESKYKSRDSHKIGDVKSGEKSQRSIIKNMTNMLRIEKQQMTKTQQVVVNDTSIENINLSSDDNNDSVKKHLDFSRNSMPKQLKSNDENSHPNIPPLNINRVVLAKSRPSTNRIPSGNLRKDQMQKSEPQKKSPNNNELLDILCADPMTHRKIEEIIRPFSNDKSSKTKSDKESIENPTQNKVNEGGSTFLQNSARQSSIHLSSHLDFNLSGSDSAENCDNASLESKLMLSKSRINGHNLYSCTPENKFEKSGQTLELSEDEEDKIEDDEAFLFISQINKSANCMSKIKNNISKDSCFKNALGELHKSKIVQSNILIQQNYMDEVKETFNKDNTNIQDDESYKYFNINPDDNDKMNVVEENKVINTEPLEIFDCNEISPNLSQNYRIVTEPNEEIQSYQKFFDQSRKFEMHNFAPKLLSEYLKQSNIKNNNNRISNKYIIKTSSNDDCDVCNCLGFDLL